MIVIVCLIHVYSSGNGLKHFPIFYGSIDIFFSILVDFHVLTDYFVLERLDFVYGFQYILNALHLNIEPSVQPFIL